MTATMATMTKTIDHRAPTELTRSSTTVRMRRQNRRRDAAEAKHLQEPDQ